jgi:hypothetical protein
VEQKPGAVWGAVRQKMMGEFTPTAGFVSTEEKRVKQAVREQATVAAE